MKLSLHLWIVTALALTFVGCVGSASMMLKSPVEDQCAKANLQRCGELTEGVLLTLDGQKEEGQRLIRSAAAANSPEKLQAFAEHFQMLRSIPGAGKYAASIDGVAALLSPDQKTADSAPPESDPDNGTARTKSTPEFLRVKTASTDLERARYGTLSVPKHANALCKEVFGDGATCAPMMRGPLFVTDLVSLGKQCEGQSVVVTKGKHVASNFEGPLDIRGARIVVPQEHLLLLVQTQSIPPSPPEAEVIPHNDCGLTWSGFIPYID